MNKIAAQFDVGDDKYCNDCPVVSFDATTCPIFNKHLKSEYQKDELGWMTNKIFRCKECIRAEVESKKPKFNKGDTVYYSKLEYDPITNSLKRVMKKQVITNIYVGKTMISYKVKGLSYRIAEKYFSDDEKEKDNEYIFRVHRNTENS